MAGHSKWANIKHRKARQDAKKGKAWSKCSRAIMAAVRESGPDPDTNLKLRYAIEESKAFNMPKDTIAKAIAKASGEGADGKTIEEVRYEGYGPQGVAVIVDCLTDNVQRTAPEIRKVFERGGGNLAKSGAVSFGFETLGQILVYKQNVNEEIVIDEAISLGANDVTKYEENWEIICKPSEFVSVLEGFRELGYECIKADVTMISRNTIDCDLIIARKVLRMIDEFEDHDDVHKVYFNASISDEIAKQL